MAVASTDRSSRWDWPPGELQEHKPLNSMIMASLSAYLTAKLLDHMKASPYLNLFTNLIYVRLILYYGLGVECLAWYHPALNDLKRECVEAETKRM